MRFGPLGSKTIVLSTGMSPKTTSPWLPLGGSYKHFTLQCERATSVATSGFTVKLFGGLTTRTTAPITIATATSAARLVFSTAIRPVSFIKWNSTKYTTAANRKLRIVMLVSG